MFDLFLEDGDLLENIEMNMELLSENNIGLIKRQKIMKDASKYYKTFTKYGKDYNDQSSNKLFKTGISSYYLLYLYDEITIEKYNELKGIIKDINKDLSDYKLRISKKGKEYNNHLYRIGISVTIENL